MFSTTELMLRTSEAYCKEKEQTEAPYWESVLHNFSATGADRQ